MNSARLLHYLGLTLLCPLIVPSAEGQRHEIGISQALQRPPLRFQSNRSGQFAEE